MIEDLNSTVNATIHIYQKELEALKIEAEELEGQSRWNNFPLVGVKERNFKNIE